MSKRGMFVVPAPDCIFCVPHPRDQELDSTPAAPALSSIGGRFLAFRPSDARRDANSRDAESRWGFMAAKVPAPPQAFQLVSGRQVGCGALISTNLPFVVASHCAKPALSFVCDRGGGTTTSPVTPLGGVPGLQGSMIASRFLTRGAS